MDRIIWLIIFFGWFSLMLSSSNGIGGRKIPMPPEHLRPKKRNKRTIGGIPHSRYYK